MIDFYFVGDIIIRFLCQTRDALCELAIYSFLVKNCFPFGVHSFSMGSRGEKPVNTCFRVHNEPLQHRSVYMSCVTNANAAPKQKEKNNGNKKATVAQCRHVDVAKLPHLHKESLLLLISGAK